ncbi:transposase [Streptomyces sp. NPDC096032]|uniref:transposase n=1 Tax=Streptomyces sp. NPDC096032 TaxID=3366070 RepID=UPI003814E997
MRLPRLGTGRPRNKPDSLAADTAYSNGPCRDYLRRRGIQHIIPEKADSQAARLRKGSRGGRPPGFDEERYKKRNTVERAINKLKTCPSCRHPVRQTRLRLPRNGHRSSPRNLAPCMTELYGVSSPTRREPGPSQRPRGRLRG